MDKIKRKAIYVLILFLAFSSVFPSIPQTLAYSASQRSWVTIELPYFANNSILIKMSACTVGNNLNKSMWITALTYDEGTTPTSVGLGNSGDKTATMNLSVSVSTSVKVVVSRAIVEATYSSDTNMTTFSYTISSSYDNIKPVGEFPNDYWRLAIQFSTDFNVTFDPREKYCEPSPNYIGRYSTTEVSGQQLTYQTDIIISHPNGFSDYVNSIYMPPIWMFTILAVALSIVLIGAGIATYKLKKNVADKILDLIIATCLAIVVFIPIFQLATQDLKTPMQFTPLDSQFNNLLVAYLTILIICIFAKLSGNIIKIKRQNDQEQKKPS